jgi:hypothetical protein
MSKLLRRLDGEICIECIIITIFLGVMVMEIASLS